MKSNKIRKNLGCVDDNYADIHSSYDAQISKPSQKPQKKSTPQPKPKQKIHPKFPQRNQQWEFPPKNLSLRKRKAGLKWTTTKMMCKDFIRVEFNCLEEISIIIFILHNESEICTYFVAPLRIVFLLLRNLLKNRFFLFE